MWLRLRLIAFLPLALLDPHPALAHGATPGLEGFYSGLLHPFTSGAQMLTLVGLSLLMQQRPEQAGAMFNSFLICCLAGAGIASTAAPGLDPDPAMTCFAGVAGILVASAFKLPRPGLLVAGGIAGLLSGYLAWPDEGGAGAMIVAATGAIVGAALIVITLAGGLEAVRQKTEWGWIAIAVRVLGSWIVAIAALTGALLFRTAS